MKNLVVNSLERLAGLVFFIIAIATAAGGYAASGVIGAVIGLEHGTSGVTGAIIGLGVGLILAVVFTGPVYVLLSINEKLGNIKEQLQSSKTPLS